ncbi:MAG: hypothetical protein ACKOBG_10485 [Actinomycetota bacterium]
MVGREPIPHRELAPSSDLSVAARVDGASDVGKVSAFRRRDRSSEPLPLSAFNFLEAVAAFAPFWEACEQIEALAADPHRRGRRAECRVADNLLVEIATRWFRSYRATIRTLNDPKTWDRLSAASIEAFPYQPNRRLSPRPPSRSQFHRFRGRYLEQAESAAVFDTWRAAGREISIQAARTIGLFDSSAGTLTEPARQNAVAGDATFIRSRFNATVGMTSVDPETGEIRPRRYDPDADTYHDGNPSNGNLLVTALARTDHPHQRLLLDFGFLPKGDRHDAHLFTDLLLDLKTDIPEIAVSLYDMAIHAADINRHLNAGIIPVAKVQRTRNGGVATFALGDHVFRRDGEPDQTLPVLAVDGTPTITVHSGGEPAAMPLALKKLERRPNANGTHTVYGIWEVPDHPAVTKRALRGATTRVRHTATDDELASGRLRTRALRPIPESEPTFARLYGGREDVESFNRHLKELLPDQRLRCVGILRNTINLTGHQIGLAITALLAHHRRTASDLSAWFGEWRPPATLLRAAA